MKAKFNLLFAILIASNLFAVTKWNGTSSAWTNGAGTESNPYLIETPQQLSYLGELVNAGVSTYQDVYFKQTTDFNMDSLAWTPIGSTTEFPFKGHYNGNNKYITGLAPKGGTDCSGLFGYAKDATFVNICIKGTLGGDGKKYCGSICAMGENIILRNCINQASIVNKGLHTGGLVGYILNGSFLECRNKGTIQAEGHAGGLVGVSNYNSAAPNQYERCSNSGRISSQTSFSSTISDGKAGGLAADGGGTFVECYNTGNVSAACNGYTYTVLATGICPSSTSMTNCFVRANVSAGGWDDKNQVACCLVKYGSPTNCYFAGHLTGTDKYIISGTNCYYDSDLLESSTATGAKTTAQMKSESMPIILNGSSYSCWEMDQHSINKGYPVLSYMNTPYQTFTIIWLNDDGSELERDNDVLYGTIPTYNGPTPIHPNDDYYTYVFRGWQPEVVVATDNATYTAQYNISAREQFILPNDILTFVSHQNGSTIGLAALASHQTIEYSTDGDTWNTMTKATTITLNNGEYIYVRGILTDNNVKAEDYTQFTISGSIEAKGNINYLWNYANPNAPLKKYCGYKLFDGCSAMTKAPELPATKLAEGCYRDMFKDCSSITTAPELPATNLANYCYIALFRGCTSLQNAPELPATVLTPHCYSQLFFGCSSLSQAPELPATTLARTCYGNMFRECTSLKTAPDLPATELVDTCYLNMFRGCSKLNYIKCLATNICANGCTLNWVNGVASTGTFIKNSNMSSWTTGNNGIPTGWIIDSETPEHETEEVNCNIRYVDKNSALISSEHITFHVPEAPVFEGFTFVKWRFVECDMSDGLTIQAVYHANYATSTSEIYTNPTNQAQKLIRDGNVYILKGDKTYDAKGQMVR